MNFCEEMLSHILGRIFIVLNLAFILSTMIIIVIKMLQQKDIVYALS